MSKSITPCLDFIINYARSAALRNRYILDHADSLFLGALDPNGSLKDLSTTPAFI